MQPVLHSLARRAPPRRATLPVAAGFAPPVLGLVKAAISRAQRRWWSLLDSNKNARRRLVGEFWEQGFRDPRETDKALAEDFEVKTLATRA